MTTSRYNLSFNDLLFTSLNSHYIYTLKRNTLRFLVERVDAAAERRGMQMRRLRCLPRCYSCPSFATVSHWTTWGSSFGIVIGSLQTKLFSPGHTHGGHSIQLRGHHCRGMQRLDLDEQSFFSVIQGVWSGTELHLMWCGWKTVAWCNKEEMDCWCELDTLSQKSSLFFVLLSLMWSFFLLDNFLFRRQYVILLILRRVLITQQNVDHVFAVWQTGTQVWFVSSILKTEPFVSNNASGQWRKHIYQQIVQQAHKRADWLSL